MGFALTIYSQNIHSTALSIGTNFWRDEFLDQQRFSEACKFQHARNPRADWVEKMELERRTFHDSPLSVPG
jgi:hypothetical protein